MAIHHARVCGACERECPTWANRCPACGSTAISFQMIVSPPSGTSIRKLADNTPRLRRNRAHVAPAQEPGVTIRTSA
jgi:predicted amidophosphoribosyltransferase